MVRLTSYLLAFFLFYALYAQDYKFRVLVTKGDNQVMRAGSETLEKLKVGTLLYKSDEILLSSGSYVSLEHSSGKTIDTRQAGINRVNLLEKYLLVAQANPGRERKEYLIGLVTVTLLIGMLVWLIMMAKKRRYNS